MFKSLQSLFMLGLFLTTSLNLSAQVGLTGSVTYTNGTFVYDSGNGIGTAYDVCPDVPIVLTPSPSAASICSSNGGVDRAFYVTGTIAPGSQTEVVPAQPDNTVMVSFHSYYRYCVRCNDGTMFESDLIYFKPSTVTEEGESCVTSLPVELSSFDGNNVDAGIALEWTTASELNNQGFEVEFSVDGRSFETVDFIAGNGTTSQIMLYKFTHKTNQFGSLYYRLKQLDFDGAYEYSDIIEVKREKPNKGNIVISPNPAIGSAFTISISNPNRLNSFVQVTDFLGKVVYSISLDAGESPTFFEKEIANLTRQIYIVTTVVGTEVTVSQVANVNLD